MNIKEGKWGKYSMENKNGKSKNYISNSLISYNNDVGSFSWSYYAGSHLKGNAAD